MKTLLLKSAVLLLATCASVTARAEWPEKPIRVVVPYSVGVGGDLIVRLISDDLARRLGQPVVVENRDGAAGNIGTMVAARSTPDGYTFLIGQTSNFVINHLLYKSFPIEPAKAFVPVVHLGTTPSVLVTSVDVPANDFPAFVNLAKSRKGQLNFGSPGVGSPAQLTLAAMNRKLDLGMTSVSYRGGVQVLTSVVSGELDLGFALQGQAKPFIDAGKIRPLLVLAGKRIPSLPNTPTFQEAGLENVGGEAWWAMVAPAGTPVAILDRMNVAVRQAMTAPQVIRQLDDFGITPLTGTRDELSQKIAREATHWAHTLKDLHISNLE